MANYLQLKAAIDQVIKANGQKEITGPVLNDTLKAIVNSLGAGYQFRGVATPSTNPGTTDQNVFYIAGQAGTYTNFNSIVLPDGVSILKWNGSWSSETVLAGDGGVFDISAYKATGGTLATFADLSAALDGGNNIPSALRKGGMSVKFVQSSDNKYVQFRLMSNQWSLVVSDWQGVDDEPTAGSNNLVKSGGVEKTFVSLHKLPIQWKAGFYFSPIGGLAENPSYSISEFIDISNITEFRIDVGGAAPDYISACLWDASFNFVRRLETGIYKVSNIADAKYLTMSSPNNLLDNNYIISSQEKEDSKIDSVSEILGINYFSEIEFMGYLSNGAISYGYPDGLGVITKLIEVSSGDKWHYKGGWQSHETAHLVFGYSDSSMSNPIMLVASGSNVDTDFIIPSNVRYIRAWTGMSKYATSSLYKYGTVLHPLNIYKNGFDNLLGNYYLYPTPTPSIPEINGICTDLMKVEINQVWKYRGGWQSHDNVGMVYGYSDKNYSNPVKLVEANEVLFERMFIIPSGVNYIAAWTRVDTNSPIIEYTNKKRIVVSRNASDYNSIRETIASISDASEDNEYEVYVPNGRWFECDIQGRDHITVVGQDRDKTILFCNGLSDNLTPSDYTYGAYKNMALSSIDRSLKHCVMPNSNCKFKNLTIEENDCKYCAHLDDRGYQQVEFYNVKFLAKTNQDTSISFSVGIGMSAYQNIMLEECIFEEEAHVQYCVFMHNQPNQVMPCSLDIRNSYFIGNYLLLEELGSEQNDTINLLNCKSSNNSPSVSYGCAKNPSTGKTYWKNGNDYEANPTLVPYSLKVNALGSNVTNIIKPEFDETYGIGRPDAEDYILY